MAPDPPGAHRPERPAPPTPDSNPADGEQLSGATMYQEFNLGAAVVTAYNQYREDNPQQADDNGYMYAYSAIPRHAASNVTGPYVNAAFTQENPAWDQGSADGTEYPYSENEFDSEAQQFEAEQTNVKERIELGQIPTSSNA